MDASLVVELLAAAPRLLGALAADLTAAQATTPPRPGEWSVAQVARHLLVGDRDTFLPRLTRMLAEERPLFDRRGAAAPTPADLAGLLEAFAVARGEAVGILGALDEAAWRRQGVSPSRGPLTVAEYAAGMAAHDTEHLRQIQDVRQALGLLPRRGEARVALPLGAIVAGIGGTPDRVRSAAEGLSPAALRHRPRDGEWSMKEVMAHLLKVERDLFLPRLRRLAAEERPVFERFDPDAWARERDHREGDFEVERRAFARVRAETVAFLAGLPAEAAGRIGLSGYFGPVSLGQYATHVVDHDLEHLDQLRRCRDAALAVR